MVSVVITCYNYGQYLAECITSVINQTYKEFEIIIVNDGSTDNTDEIVIPFLQMPNFIYITQENSGQTVAKNSGIKISKGEFIAFLDADDFWHPTKLEKQVPLFKNNVGVVYSLIQLIDENSKELDNGTTPKYLQPQRGLIRESIIFDNFIAFSSSIVKKECFAKAGMFDESLKMGIDWDLWLRISAEYHFDYVDEKLLYYRVGHSNQMSKNIIERYSCADRIFEKIIEKPPDFVSHNTLKKALLYSYCNRGENFRNVDLTISFRYFVKAMKKNPLEINVYKGFLRNLLKIVKL
jgi:glycosyltransferase involved in cell wall biosynthesis